MYKNQQCQILMISDDNENNPSRIINHHCQIMMISDKENNASRIINQ
jgi:hypothetical protein